jgi:hypothetical protein
MKTAGTVVLALMLLLPMPVLAQNCGALGKEVRAVQSDAFDEYPLLNDVKQGVLLMLYGRGSADCPQELYDFASQGKKFVVLFDEAYKLGRSNKSEDRLAALNLSYTLEDMATAMLEQKDLGASALDVATSAKNVLVNFLITQGKYNEREGELTNRTRDKIAYYRQATLAYEAADENILAANTRLNWETLEKEYTKDMGIAEDMYSKAESKLGEAKSLSRGTLSKMMAYVNAMEALELYKGALLYYTKHYESEKIQEIREKITEVEGVMDSLRSTLMLYFLILTLFLTAVALFLLNRLLAWNADTYEYYLGNELIKVKGVEY